MTQSAAVRSVTVTLRADVTAYRRATADVSRDTRRMAADASTAAQQMTRAHRDAGKAAEQASRVQRDASRQAAAAKRQEAAAAKAAEAEQRKAAKAVEAANRAAEKAAKDRAKAEEKAARQAAQAQRQAAREAEKAARAEKRALEERQQAMTDFGQTVAAVSAAVEAAGLAAVVAFAGFDAQMSRVSAASQASAEDLAALRDAALAAGRATQYSATEAAKAQEELVKAGLSVQDIIGGGLRGSMSLAAAGNLELAEAAEIAANAMTTFNLSGSEVPRVADLLAAGAGKAVGSVDELAYALKQTGLVAAQLDVPIEETIGTLSAFAQNALRGSDAGTSLKVMLQRLVPQSDEAAATMQRLGLDFFDAQGQFIGLAGTAEMLQQRMGLLSEEQRLQAMTTIFGSDAIRAANVLYKEGGEGIAEWTENVNDAGYAGRVAAEMTDNLRGDLERLKGALETALIDAGGASAGVMRELAQGATSAVDAFGALPGPVRQGGVALALVAGAVGLAAAGFLVLVPRIAETRTAMATLGITAATTKARLAGVAAVVGGPWGLAITAGITALGWFATQNAKAKQQVEDLTASLDAQTGSFTESTAEIVRQQLTSNGSIDWAKELGLSLEDVSAAAFGSEAALARLDAQARRGQITDQREIAANRDKIAMYESLRRQILDQDEALKKSKTEWQDKQKILEGVGGAYAAAEGGAVDYTSAVSGVAGAEQLAAQATQALTDALDASANAFLKGREASRGYQAALDDAQKALEKNGRTLDENTEKGRDNAAALDDVASRAMTNLQRILENDGPGKKFQKTLKDSREDLYKLARQFGMTREDARKYVDRLLKIPKSVSTKVTATGLDALIRKTHTALRTIRDLDGRVASVTIRTTDTVVGPDGQTSVRVRSREAMAEGGPVPLTPGARHGVDSVPALLMPDEYVVRAPVARANRQFLDALNSGRPIRGYAVGGSVSGGAGVVAPSVSAPRVVMVPVSETHTTAASVHVGTVVTQDARSFLGWGVSRSFSATGGVS